MNDDLQASESLDTPELGGPKSNLLEISNTIVGLHKQFYGRGPTKARTTLARDVLVVVLEGGFTQAERTLAESGRTDAVQDSRFAMQDVIKKYWIDAVEGLLGRRVRTFLSANDPTEQIQVETFILEHEDVGMTPELAATDGHAPPSGGRDGRP